MLLNQVKYIGGASLKIVSLVPSQTELLYELCLEDEVIGITKFCVHPPSWFNVKTKIGGTKTLKIDLIRQLNPTLIIANREENEKAQVELLSKEFNVWVTDVNDLENSFNMIKDIGILTGTADKAMNLIKEIRRRLSKPTLLNKKIPAAYLIWKKPYMAAGGGTFINSMMEYCGFQNIFGDTTRYPETSIEEIKNLNCELLLLPSEPYPFKMKHLIELKKLLPGIKIVLADGEMFSWYGSRLLLAPQYFKSLLKVISQV